MVVTIDEEERGVVVAVVAIEVEEAVAGVGHRSLEAAVASRHSEVIEVMEGGEGGELVVAVAVV